MAWQDESGQWHDDNGMPIDPPNAGGDPPAPDDFWDEDPTAAITAAYQQRLGRAPDATELASEIENYGKYGAGQLDSNLLERAKSNGGGATSFDRSGGGSSMSSGSTSGAPQSIQPFSTPFAFDGSRLGESEGFKFRFDKAMQAIQRSGAAKGTLLNPQTIQALQGEASGLAAQELDAEFGRQAGTYDRNFQTHAWNEGNRYTSQRQNRTDDWGFMDGDRRFNRGVYESDRGFDYGRQRDTMDDYWKYVDYGYNAARNPR